MEQLAQISVDGKFVLELFINLRDGYIIAEDTVAKVLGPDCPYHYFPLHTKLEPLLQSVGVDIDSITHIWAPLYKGFFNELNNVELWLNTPVKVHDLFQLDINTNLTE